MERRFEFAGKEFPCEGLLAAEAFLSDAFPDCAAWFHYSGGVVVSGSSRGTGAARALSCLDAAMASSGLIATGSGEWSRPGVAGAGAWFRPGSVSGVERNGPILAARLVEGGLVHLPFDREEDVHLTGILA